MLDLARPMRTRSGKRVINLVFKPLNDVGDVVTFPIKGSVVVREKPLRLRYATWTEHGAASVFREAHPNDLLLDIGAADAAA